MAIGWGRLAIPKKHFVILRSALCDEGPVHFHQRPRKRSVMHAGLKPHDPTAFNSPSTVSYSIRSTQSK
jgi:hypothetical protein